MYLLTKILRIYIIDYFNYIFNVILVHIMLTAMNNLYSVRSIYFYFLRIKSGSINRDSSLFRVIATSDLVLLIAIYLMSHTYLKSSNLL